MKDETTLEDNKVSENGFMVVMVTKVLLIFDCTLVRELLFEPC